MGKGGGFVNGLFSGVVFVYGLFSGGAVLGLLSGRLFGPSRDSFTDGMLTQVAVARGLSNADELLVSLGKQQSGISSKEAVDLMVRELGGLAYVEYTRTYFYSTPKECEDTMNKYLKFSESGDKLMAEATLNFWRKYCDHKGDEKK